jgi:Uncharacterized protein conserved in bacteria (DUF2188)
LARLSRPWLREAPMTQIVYDIVEHDGGWAFKLGDTLSQTYPTHAAALAAATRVAAEQQSPDETTPIEWEDEAGQWHEEIAAGDDRPEVTIHDTPDEESRSD